MQTGKIVSCWVELYKRLFLCYWQREVYHCQLVLISEMASGFTPAAKRSRTANEGTSVRKQGKELGIPWEDICPAQISDWLDMFSKAHNTTREIPLASILPTVACLMGQSTIKVGCRIKAESVNLFVICLCDPGAGKSPAFKHGCAQPLRLRQLKATPGHKVIIGKEEASQFFEQLLGGSREKSRIDLERLIRLYDGSTWVYTRGDKTARQIIDNPGVSLSGYSQPNRFFPIYVTLKERRDGGVDRMISYQPLPHHLAARETREFITKLNDSPVTYWLDQSLRQHTYSCH